MSGEILLAREGDIATVTLSNPGKLNALGLGSWKQLGETMRGLDADKRLRCILIRGAGSRNELSELSCPVLQRACSQT